MAKKKAAAHGGGHGWFVTFADLMGLLVAFFVMLVAFSTQDQKKLQIVAGSLRDAFGVQTAVRYSGLIEVDGLPTRPHLKNAANINPEDASPTPGPGKNTGNRTKFGQLLKTDDGAFSLASASLRQALQDLPELAEISKQVMFEETKQGLNIEIVDQDGRAMFPENIAEPYEHTRRLVQRLAVKLKDLPFRITVSGHTTATKTPPKPGYGLWELSADRANAIRRILQEESVPSSQLYMVAGRADTQPLFPDNPAIAPNRRVTITLMREAPPMPVGLAP